MRFFQFEVVVQREGVGCRVEDVVEQRVHGCKVLDAISSHANSGIPLVKVHLYFDSMADGLHRDASLMINSSDENTVCAQGWLAHEKWT
jgi:hypothetical protein